MDQIISVSFSCKLYKKDTKNKVRVLEIYAEGPELVQRSGILGGAMVEHRKTCTVKNKGKTNEVNVYEQAILQAKSKVAEKLTEGYFDSLKALDKGADDVMLPMLAQDYHKHSQKIDWNKPVYAQPKLDGMRALCFIKKDKIFFLSRQGKIIKYMDHILKELDFIKDEVVLDGELYMGPGTTFQENMQAMKKYTPGLTEQVQYHVYDIICKNPYSERLDLLKKLFS